MTVQLWAIKDTDENEIICVAPHSDLAWVRAMCMLQMAQPVMESAGYRCIRVEVTEIPS